MGLAERFREQLEKKDIFTDRKNNSIKEVIDSKQENSSDIIYSIDVETISNMKKYTTNVIQKSTEQSVLKPVTKLEDLRKSIVSKISNTPCWNEYSQITQTKMLEKYFDIKMKNENYTISDKTEFINSILNSQTL